MTEISTQLSEQYRTALQLYLAGQGEAALQSAYELGRSAVKSAVGCLDLVKIHQDVMLLAMLDAPTPEECAQIAMLGTDFFAECLSPYEMTHRGYREALVALSRRNVEVAATNQQLEAEIRERKRAEEKLKELPKRILEAQEAERRKIAHELHDEVCQRMSATKLHIEAFESEIPSRNAKLHKKLLEIKKQINLKIKEVRRISEHLRPSTLDDMVL